MRYWRELLARRQTVRLCFYRTPYIFRKIRELIREKLEPRKHEFAFSFQTQSLYDGSVPGLTHFVYTDHTHLTNLRYPAFPREELFSLEWVDLEREIYRDASHVFVMSEHVRQSLIDSYGCNPADSSCVFAGSNIDPTPIPLGNDGYRNQTVIFVGVDWERKGGPSLLQAFQKLLVKLPAARLVILGSRPRIRHPQIEVLGRVPPEEVKRRLAQASVFCLPTRVEPFGIAVVEAFFHKLPVVTTNIGAMPGLVHPGKSGILIPPGDSDALAAALLELLSDPAKCREFGEYGRKVVSEIYSWDEVGRKLHQGVEAVLQNGREPEECELLVPAGRE
jgi:glycosyltransferase involved in cell wall biosynthesis